MNVTSEQLLHEYHAAMVSGDSDALADLYAHDGVHEFPFFTPGGVRRLEGPEQICEFYAPRWAARGVWIDRVETVFPHRLANEADRVVNGFVSVGRRRDDGAPFRLAGLLILTARDGKIVHVLDYMDIAGLQNQLG